jgi:hypothetical protein
MNIESKNAGPVIDLADYGPKPFSGVRPVLESQPGRNSVQSPEEEQY